MRVSYALFLWCVSMHLPMRLLYACFRIVSSCGVPMLFSLCVFPALFYYVLSRWLFPCVFLMLCTYMVSVRVFPIVCSYVIFLCIFTMYVSNAFSDVVSLCWVSSYGSYMCSCGGFPMFVLLCVVLLRMLLYGLPMRCYYEVFIYGVPAVFFICIFPMRLLCVVPIVGVICTAPMLFYIWQFPMCFAMRVSYVFSLCDSNVFSGVCVSYDCRMCCFPMHCSMRFSIWMSCVFSPCFPLCSFPMFVFRYVFICASQCIFPVFCVYAFFGCVVICYVSMRFPTLFSNVFSYAVLLCYFPMQFVYVVFHMRFFMSFS